MYSESHSSQMISPITWIQCQCSLPYISSVPCAHKHENVNLRILCVYKYSQYSGVTAEEPQLWSQWAMADWCVFTVRFTSISLGFIHTPFRSGFEISGRGEQLQCQECSQVLARKRVMSHKAQNFKRCFCTCAQQGRSEGLLTPLEPAWWCDVTEFGNGSDIWKITAQKYPGDSVWFYPQSRSSAVLFLQEVFIWVAIW